MDDTNSEKAVLVGDMDCVRLMGLERFLSNCSWPISDDEFCGFVDRVMNSFGTHIAECNQEIFDLVLSDYRFLNFLFQHVHYNAVFARTRKNSNFKVNEEEGGNFLNPDWELLANEFANKNMGNSFTLPRKEKLHWLRSVYWQIRNNYSLNSQICSRWKRFKSLFNYDVVSIGANGAPDWLKVEYICKNEVTCNYLEWDRLISGYSTRKGEELCTSHLEMEFIEPFFEYFLVEANKIGFAISHSKLKDTWSRRLVDLSRFYFSARDNPHRIKRLYVTGGGNPLRKAIATGLASTGVEVTAFLHGNCAGIDIHPHGHLSHSGCVDVFVCPTEQIARNHRVAYSKLPILVRRKTKYVAAESNYYNSIFDEYQSHCCDNDAPIMIIGYPLNTYRYLDGSGYFFYFQLDLQVRLAKLLKENGHQIIYKAHPDRLSEAEGIFNGLVDYVETRPFERVWQNASTYLFTHPGTTVFGESLLTNRNIVLINIQRKWNLEGFKALRERCHMVDGWYSESNRVNFDTKLLLDAMHSSDKKDYGVVNKYFFRN